MKKKKFMTTYLREDEWEFIKKAMINCEHRCEELILTQQRLNIKPSDILMAQYKLVYHFNHVAIDNIEDLAKKEERRRKRDKQKQRKI